MRDVPAVVDAGESGGGVEEVGRYRRVRGAEVYAGGWEVED